MLVEIPQNPKILRFDDVASAWECATVDQIRENDKVIFFESDWKVFQLQEGSIFVNGSKPVYIKDIANRKRIDVEFA